MKRLLLFGVGCLVTATLHAQTPATVYTPKGTAVPALIFNEMSAADITNTNNLAAAQYPDATRIDNASAQYNCHAYAFHLTEGNTNRVWINTPGDDAYWNDGSFVRVCNEANGTKVSYPSGDHSAIRSAQSIPLGRYDSKWGQWPLLRHAPTYTPYNSTGLRYYVSTAMSGPSSLCTTNSTFSVASVSGATYSWTTSSNVVLTGSGNSVAVRASNNAAGSGWVQVTINSPCGGVATTRKNVTMGNPTATASTLIWTGTRGVNPVSTSPGTT